MAELEERPTRPAKMRALHSSAVLAVNVFDHWVGRDAAALLAALGVASKLQVLSFEAGLSTGLAGKPPRLDLVLKLTNGRLVGIESKFTEWLASKRTNRAAFKAKYFEAGIAYWADGGLPKCQELAADLMSGRERYRHLNAAQLLKHALGLATQCPRRFALRYIYFDVPGRAKAVHDAELARFAARVDAALGFKALSYQNLYAALAESDAMDADYLAYLGSRYM